MDWLLLGFFIFLVQGETMSEIRGEYKPPVLQSLLLSDVSNIQLNSGRRSYFGAAPEMAGTLDPHSQNTGGNKQVGKGRSDTVVRSSQSFERKDRMDSPPLSSLSAAGIRKQFEDSFQPRRSDADSGQAVPTEALSRNSSQTGLDPTGSNTVPTDKINSTDEQTSLQEVTSVSSKSVFPPTGTNETAHVTKSTQLLVTVPATETTEPNTTAATPGNVTSSPTTCETCPDDPGLIAGLAGPP